jgi:hypothetical protein
MKECNQNTYIEYEISAYSSLLQHYSQLPSNEISLGVPKHDRVKEMWHMYTMEYFSAKCKNEILSFAVIWMELEIMTLNEICQAQKDESHMVLHICRNYTIITTLLLLMTIIMKY